MRGGSRKLSQLVHDWDIVPVAEQVEPKYHDPEYSLWRGFWAHALVLWYLVHSSNVQNPCWFTILLGLYYPI